MYQYTKPRSLKRFTTHLIFMSAMLLNSLITITASELDNQLKTVGQFPPSNYTPWQSIIKNPLRSNAFFVFNRTGQINAIEKDNFSSLPLISLKQYYPQLKQLNALVLHPNFALNQQIGSLTLYSAHTELADPNKRTLRVKDKKTYRDV